MTVQPAQTVTTRDINKILKGHYSFQYWYEIPSIFKKKKKKEAVSPFDMRL